MKSIPVQHSGAGQTHDSHYRLGSNAVSAAPSYFSRATVPPQALPRSMAWLLAVSLIALATLPWAIPVLIVRIITP